MFMEINRTNIFNNTAQFGGVISACNSQVTLLDDGLFVTVDPVLPFCTLYEGDIQSYNITAPQDPEIFTTEFLTTTDQQTTTEPLMTTQRQTTTELLITTEPLTSTAQTTTESQTRELTTEPTTTELQISTEPLTSADSEPLSTTEQPAITELLTSTEPPIMTEEITTEPLPTTTDQTDNMSPPVIVTMENTNMTTSNDTQTSLTTTIKETSTMQDGSLSTASAITMNNPTSTTESLGRDVDHFTTRDQTTATTELESDKKGDVYVVISESDSKLNTVLSATALALFLVLSVVVFVLVVFLCTHNRRAKESKSTKIELIKMEELTEKENISPAHNFNTYVSPVHNRYSSEEKVDIM